MDKLIEHCKTCKGQSPIDNDTYCAGCSYLEPKTSDTVETKFCDNCNAVTNVDENGNCTSCKS